MFNLRRIGAAIVSILVAFVVVSPGVAVAQLLPDLTMLQPNEFRLELLSGGVRRLRFSTYIVNLGPGRFDVIGSDPDPADSTKLTRVTQRLEQSGGWVTQPTPATMFYSGDGHDHWHVFGLQDFKLAFQATPSERIATGVKTGFCFWDNVNLSGAPRFYTGATECHQQTNGTVPMGLSVNWGDKYPWSIGFQYIDVSQLPYGNYCLTLTADPRGEFIEASTANNSTQTLISIQPDGVTVLAANCGQGVTPPATPTGLNATARDRAVDLNWNDNTDTVTGYKVYRGTNAGVATTASAYTDTGLTNGTSYCYRVTAVNGAGNESSPTAQTCATPVAPARVVHVADLDRIAKGKGKSGKWDASVTVTVRDAAAALVAGATVTGNWSGAVSRTVSGVTASNGSVTLASGAISGGTSVTFTVTNVAGTGLTYNAAANADPDGDSNGTAITIARP